MNEETLARLKEDEETLARLKEDEQKALIKYDTRLRQHYNGLIVAMILFGSKARGDVRGDSDVDLLVVVDSDDWRLHKELRSWSEACTECNRSDGRGTLLAPYTYENLGEFTER
jgi:predicted nucleotidyltransferase